MAEYVTTDTELTSIANAIRVKGGTSDALAYPTEFIEAINAIETTPETQNKTISPTEAKQTVLPDTDYLLSSVTVNAIPSDYIGSSVPIHDSSDLSVSGAVVSVPSGYYEEAASTTLPTGAVEVYPITVTVGIGTVTLDSATGVISINRNEKKCQPDVYVSNDGYLTVGRYTSTTSNVTISSNSTTYALPTVAAATYTPSSSTQTISSGVYLTGVQTIEPIPISVDNHRLIVPEGYIGV